MENETIENPSNTGLPTDRLSYVLNSILIITECFTIFLFTWQSFFIPSYWILDFTQFYVFYKWIQHLVKDSVIYDVWKLIKKHQISKQ